jgi:poly(3-hydroxyalkanoate) depolymerase
MAETRLQLQYFRLGGVQVRAGVAKGTGGGLPLLIFNGVGASMELLEPLVAALPEREIITYDVPGAGESGTPGRPWRMRHHARLADRLLDRLGYGRVNVLGISWGGALAQQFARQYSDRCEKLILAATTPGQLMVPPRLSVMLRMSSPLRYWSPDYMMAIAPKIYGGSLRTNKLKAREHANKMKPPSVKGYYFQVMALMGWSSLPWLHKLKQPTLVMAGDDDPIIPLINGKLLALRIPDSRLRIVDCGHLFILTRADTLAPEIEAFLA